MLHLACRVLIAAHLLVAPLMAATQAAGSNDSTFNAQDNGTYGDGPNAPVRVIRVQSDGRAVIGGAFSTYNGLARAGVARLNADGSADLSFNPGAGVTGFVNAVRIQADGRILIGGEFTAYNGTARNRLARINSGGTLDASFDPGVGSNGEIQDLQVQPDGRVVIGGFFSQFAGTARNGLARLTASGVLDTTFNPGSGVAQGTVMAIALQADGKILIGGSFVTFNGTARSGIARVNTNGTLDTTFNPGTGVSQGPVRSIAVQVDGKVVIAGDFLSVNGLSRPGVARLNSNGSVDTTFSPGSGFNGIVTSLALQADGKLILGGDFTSYNGFSVNRAARIQADGGVDAAFAPPSAVDFVHALALQADGKVLSGCDVVTTNGLIRNRIARLIASGSEDAAFNPGSGANDTVFRVVRQSDGKLLLGGAFTSLNGMPRNGIGRLLEDGSLDTGFQPGSGADGRVTAVAQQSDGKVLIGGDFTSVGGLARGRIARLMANGAIDTAFGSGGGANGSVSAIVVQADGRILIGGEFTAFNGVARNGFARVLSDGTLDPAFSAGSGAGGSLPTVNVIAIQTDGRILLGGGFTSIQGTARNRIARLLTDGVLDTSFNPGSGVGGFVPYVSTLALQADGKLLLAGSFSSVGGVARENIARLLSTGSVDAGFNPGTGANGTISALAIQPDGKVLIGGGFTNYSGSPAPGIARLNADASLDVGFDPGVGPNYGVGAIALQPDGKAIVGGVFTQYAGITRHRIARIFAYTAFPPFCFGDGSTGALCPCGNQGAAGRGCNNSLVNGGAQLQATGSPAGDSVILSSSGELATALTIFLQGTTSLAAPAVFGDGLRCVGGTLKRLYVKSAAGGIAAAPAAGDPSIRNQSTFLGDPIPSGATRHYQAYYRDASATYCPAPSGGTFNVSNGLSIIWP